MRGTLVQWYRAEFKHVMFGGPGTAAWEVTGHWQTQETRPYALSTVVRDLLDSGWRELGAYDVRRSFPRGDAGGIRVDRAFVHSAGGSHYGQIATLTDKRRGLIKAENEVTS